MSIEKRHQPRTSPRAAVPIGKFQLLREAVSVATREGDPQIALQARRNHAVTGAQHRFNVVTMPADASRLNNSSANHRVWILCTTLKNGFPTLKIGGGGPLHPQAVYLPGCRVEGGVGWGCRGPPPPILRVGNPFLRVLHNIQTL